MGEDWEGTGVAEGVETVGGVEDLMETSVIPPWTLVLLSLSVFYR